MKSRLVLLAAAAWLALPIAPCFADHPYPSLAETRTKAEQGEAGPQNWLGFVYRYGNGVKQDNAEALKWFRKSAEQGFANAQANLGIMYFRGEGVKRDYVEAYKWLSLAAAQGDPDAESTIIMAVNPMTPEQIEEAKKRAHDWKPKTN